MQPPKNANGPGANRAEREKNNAKETVAAFCTHVKNTILAALAGKVVTGSDFEARRLRAREAAQAKGGKQ